MSLTMNALRAAVSNQPDAAAFAQIAVQSEQPLEDDLSRAYRFTIESGGRKLWQQWFDHEPIFLKTDSESVFEAQIAAFPTNPRTDYGYIRLVRQL